MQRLFGAAFLPPSNFPPRYNIAPTQDIPIVRPRREADGREVVFVRWGLIPFFMKEKPAQPHINARAETVDRIPLFREACGRRRCLVPATGFYEWQHHGKERQPYRILLRDHDPFAFAGVWESARIGEERIQSATIIVTAANELVSELHDRMPVILDPADYARWLDPETRPEEAKALLRPFPSERMEAYPVSKLVNKYENDSPACIAPITLERPDPPAQLDLL